MPNIDLRTFCSAGYHINRISGFSGAAINIFYVEYGKIDLEDLFEKNYRIASSVAHSFQIINECVGAPTKEEKDTFYPHMKWALKVYEKAVKEDPSLFI
jgi:hypothetical protein